MPKGHHHDSGRREEPGEHRHSARQLLALSRAKVSPRPFARSRVQAGAAARMRRTERKLMPKSVVPRIPRARPVIFRDLSVACYIGLAHGLGETHDAHERHLFYASHARLDTGGCCCRTWPRLGANLEQASIDGIGATVTRVSSRDTPLR